MHEKIVILDFGGQYAHLIASRIRRQQVLAEIHQPDEVPFEVLQDPLVKGIILSGGPQSVYDEGSAACDPRVFELDKPVLGICYGHQYMNQTLGGKVVPGDQSGKEFGRADLTHNQTCPLFANIPPTSTFWMSHGDEVETLGQGFVGVGDTPLCKNAAVWNQDKNLFGIQFHPEVTHSEYGTQLLTNFLTICQVKGDWTMQLFLSEHKKRLAAQIGDKNVVLFVSGGVDSTVAFALLSQILGPDRVQGLFVDNGLLRHKEVEYVEKSITAIGAKLTVMREADLFIGNLKDLYEPEAKRETIGNTFLQVQRRFFAQNQLDNNTILAQGTIYPDTIETGATKNAVTIKTHHNRVPEIQAMIDAGKVIEPLADLYKDEVRALGELLGLPHELVWRHPFPGPGLGVRILCNNNPQHITDCEPFIKPHYTQLPLQSVGVQGDFRTYRHPGVLNVQPSANHFDLAAWEQQATQLINQSNDVNRMLVPLGYQSDQSISSMTLLDTDLTYQRVERLQQADHIVTQALMEMGLYEDIWQFPVVLAPIGFNETGQESIILRPIDSIDAMSATVGKLPFDFFSRVTANILKDSTLSAVFLDVTSKPPGTIEWE